MCGLELIECIGSTSFGISMMDYLYDGIKCLNGCDLWAYYI